MRLNPTENAPYTTRVTPSIDLAASRLDENCVSESVSVTVKLRKHAIPFSINVDRKWCVMRGKIGYLTSAVMAKSKEYVMRVCKPTKHIPDL